MLVFRPSLTFSIQCVDSRNTLAVLELSYPDDMFDARLPINHAGLAIVIETLMTALRLVSLPRIHPVLRLNSSSNVPKHYQMDEGLYHL